MSTFRSGGGRGFGRGGRGGGSGRQQQPPSTNSVDCIPPGINWHSPVPPPGYVPGKGRGDDGFMTSVELRAVLDARETERMQSKPTSSSAGTKHGKNQSAGNTNTNPMAEEIAASVAAAQAAAQQAQMEAAAAFQSQNVSADVAKQMQQQQADAAKKEDEALAKVGIPAVPKIRVDAGQAKADLERERRADATEKTDELLPTAVVARGRAERDFQQFVSGVTAAASEGASDALDEEGGVEYCIMDTTTTHDMAEVTKYRVIIEDRIKSSIASGAPAALMSIEREYIKLAHLHIIESGGSIRAGYEVLKRGCTVECPDNPMLWMVAVQFARSFSIPPSAKADTTVTTLSSSGDHQPTRNVNDEARTLTRRAVEHFVSSLIEENAAEQQQQATNNTTADAADAMRGQNTATSTKKKKMPLPTPGSRHYGALLTLINLAIDNESSGINSNRDAKLKMLGHAVTLAPTHDPFWDQLFGLEPPESHREILTKAMTALRKLNTTIPATLWIRLARFELAGVFDRNENDTVLDDESSAKKIERAKKIIASGLKNHRSSSLSVTLWLMKALVETQEKRNANKKMSGSSSSSSTTTAYSASSLSPLVADLVSSPTSTITAGVRQVFEQETAMIAAQQSANTSSANMRSAASVSYSTASLWSMHVLKFLDENDVDVAEAGGRNITTIMNISTGNSSPHAIVARAVCEALFGSRATANLPGLNVADCAAAFVGAVNSHHQYSSTTTQQQGASSQVLERCPEVATSSSVLYHRLYLNNTWRKMKTSSSDSSAASLAISVMVLHALHHEQDFFAQTTTKQEVDAATPLSGPAGSAQQQQQQQPKATLADAVFEVILCQLLAAGDSSHDVVSAALCECMTAMFSCSTTTADFTTFSRFSLCCGAVVAMFRRRLPHDNQQEVSALSCGIEMLKKLRRPIKQDETTKGERKFEVSSPPALWIDTVLFVWLHHRSILVRSVDAASVRESDSDDSFFTVETIDERIKSGITVVATGNQPEHSASQQLVAYLLLVRFVGKCCNCAAAAGDVPALLSQLEQIEGEAKNVKFESLATRTSLLSTMRIARWTVSASSSSSSSSSSASSSAPVGGGEEQHRLTTLSWDDLLIDSSVDCRLPLHFALTGNFGATKARAIVEDQIRGVEAKLGRSLEEHTALLRQNVSSSRINACVATVQRRTNSLCHLIATRILFERTNAVDRARIVDRFESTKAMWRRGAAVSFSRVRPVNFGSDLLLLGLSRVGGHPDPFIELQRVLFNDDHASSSTKSLFKISGATLDIPDALRPVAVSFDGSRVGLPSLDLLMHTFFECRAGLSAQARGDALKQQLRDSRELYGDVDDFLSRVAGRSSSSGAAGTATSNSGVRPFPRIYLATHDSYQAIGKHDRALGEAGKAVDAAVLMHSLGRPANALVAAFSTHPTAMLSGSIKPAFEGSLLKLRQEQQQPQPHQQQQQQQQQQAPALTRDELLPNPLSDELDAAFSSSLLSLSSGYVGE